MLSIELEVLRVCGRASLLSNSLSQPLSCCAALRVQESACSTSSSPVDHRLQALTGGTQVDELSRLHQKFLRIKVTTRPPREGPDDNLS